MNKAPSPPPPPPATLRLHKPAVGITIWTEAVKLITDATNAILPVMQLKGIRSWNKPPQVSRRCCRDVRPRQLDDAEEAAAPINLSSTLSSDGSVMHNNYLAAHAERCTHTFFFCILDVVVRNSPVCQVHRETTRLRRHAVRNVDASICTADWANLLGASSCLMLRWFSKPTAEIQEYLDVKCGFLFHPGSCTEHCRFTG